VFFAGAGHDGGAWRAGAALLGGNLLDEIAYTLADRWLGTSLDLLSRADGAFRLVAGRRNVYTAILLVGWLCGAAYAAFVVAASWAVVTGGVHALRLLWALAAKRRIEAGR